MIGDLIKISPKQLPALRGGKRRKLPLWKRAWVRSLITYTALTLLALYVGALMWLKQFRERASEFNLTELKQLEISTLLFDRNAREIAEIAEEARRASKIDDVPQHFINALRAAEDGRFMEHQGVDFMGIARAALMNARKGKNTQGASTITQQLARQTFKKTDPTMMDKTVGRKITEIYLAKRIEENFTKSEILEMYLNRIYFGSGTHGVNSAAMRYFGKRVNDLTISESATICGLIKSPERYSPLRDLAAAKRNRNQVLSRMVDENFLSASEAEILKAQEVVVHPVASTKGGSYLVSKIHQEAAPILQELGFDEMLGKGLQIHTTLDADVQRAAEESVLKRLNEIEARREYLAWVEEINKRPDQKSPKRVTYKDYQKTFDTFLRSLKNRPDPESAVPPEPNYLQAAVVLLNNRTGAVIAMVGGRDFNHNQFNLADDGVHATGTAFLPFLFGAAFESKMFPGTRLSDAPLDNSRIMLGSMEGILGEWGREGMSDLFQGKITARGALIQSMNGASARLGLDIGLDKVRDFAARAGLGDMKDLPSTLLGASECSLRNVALSYTTFPNNGYRPETTHLISRITDAEGNELWKRPPERAKIPVTDDITAYMVTSCLEDCLSVGTGSSAHEYGLKEGAFAGKTGTHYEFRDLTFAGYSSEVTCAVWTGMKDRPETIYPSAFSSKCALPIWVDVMNAVSAKHPPQPFTIPERIQQVELCALSGLRSTDRCFTVVEDPATHRRIFSKTIYKEYVRPNFKFDAICDVHTSENSSEGNLTNTSSEPPKISFTEINKSKLTQGNSIPVTIKEPIIIGTDPYHAKRLVINTAPPSSSSVPTPKENSKETEISLSPELKNTKIEIPEPPPVPIE